VEHGMWIHGRKVDIDYVFEVVDRFSGWTLYITWNTYGMWEK
jgi:hypothetical protein